MAEELTPASLHDYVGYVTERHHAWSARQLGLPREDWTQDHIIAAAKFCNSFRLLDRGSQFVARELLAPLADDQEREALFRALFYRFTNLPDAWENFLQRVGRYPLEEDLGPEGTLRRVMGEWQASGGRVFSGAYTIGPGPNNTGVPRLEFAIRVAESIMRSPVADEVLAAEGVEARVRTLAAAPQMGVFIALQTQTDFGYRFGDTEDQWAGIGPGSRRGLQRLFPRETFGLSREAQARSLDHMRELQALVEESPRAPRIELADGSSRGLSIMDIQNTLCEFDKYVRAQHSESRRVRRFTPSTEPLEDPFIPPHWRSLD